MSVLKVLFPSKKNCRYGSSPKLTDTLGWVKVKCRAWHSFIRYHFPVGCGASKISPPNLFKLRAITNYVNIEIITCSPSIVMLEMHQIVQTFRPQDLTNEVAPCDLHCCVMACVEVSGFLCPSLTFVYKVCSHAVNITNHLFLGREGLKHRRELDYFVAVCTNHHLGP